MAIATINPFTAETVRIFEPLTREGLEGKLQAATEAFQRHRRTTPSDRARWLAQAAEILEREQDRFGPTWLHRIAVNTVLEKRRGPSKAEVSVEDPGEYEEPTMVFDTPVEEEELEAAIESLPQGARDALVLCGVYGYEHQFLE
jgi:DNA-directed RNA polymerase specialized sigma24 family protein